MHLRFSGATSKWLAMLTGAAAMSAAALPAGAVTVWTQHYDNSRSGANTSETALTTSNVNSTSFGKLFACAVDANLYAQPLYVPGLTVNGATHNVVYVATMNNSVYAFDADNGAQLWYKNYGTPVPSGDVQCCCTDIVGNIGIESTPVIDTSTNTMYFVYRNKNSDSTYHQWLRAVDITTGADKFSSPHEITATKSGITFNAEIQNQRSALTLANGTVYIAWASHNDCGDYHGWIIGYQASNVTNQQYTYLDTTGSDDLGGIWMSGQGLTVDGSNNIYLNTGNGYYDGSSNFGDTMLKLNSGLTLQDWFTPSDQASLSSADNDLGSGGVLGLPSTAYVVGGGKDGRLFLVNTANMGKYNTSTDQVVQEWQAVALNGSTTHIHGSPVYFNGSIYVWGENDHGRQYKFNGSSFTTTASSTTSITAPSGMPGGILSASGNGTTNGIIWASLPYNADANHATVAGELHAYNASNLGQELWNSYQNKSRDDYGNFAKYCPPVVANGKVYMSTFSNQLVVYGVLAAATTAPSTPTGVTATAGSAQVTLTWAAASGATSYSVYRSTTSGGEGTTPIATGVTTTTYTNTGLTNGTKYYYKVAAVNSIGASAQSSEVSATPAASTTIANGAHTLTPQCATGSRLDDASDATTNGNKVDIYTANGTSAQNWVFANISGTNYNMALQNGPSGGACLDVTGAGTANGTLVELWQCNGTSAQSWNGVQNSNGTYQFKPACAPSSCLDVPGATSTNGTQVEIYTCNSTNAQQWAVN